MKKKKKKKKRKKRKRKKNKSPSNEQRMLSVLGNSVEGIHMRNGLVVLIEKNCSSTIWTFSLANLLFNSC